MHFAAFGLDLTADFPLPAAGNAAPDRRQGNPVTLTEVPPGTLFSLTGDARYLRHLQTYEGCPYATLESPGGDILFHYGWRALFALSQDGRELRCEFSGGRHPASDRVLLDTVLWTVSLRHGFELLHASAVRTEAGVVAFSALSGGGKTSLAAECLRRGATLFADDVVALAPAADGILAHPGPRVMNLPRTLAVDAIHGARALADFGDERWVELEPDPSAPPAPAPLAAIVLLRRAPDQPLSVSRTAATNLALLPLSISLPHMTDRQRARFDILGQLAARTPVFTLTADLTVPPAALADALQAEGVLP